MNLEKTLSITKNIALAAGKNLIENWFTAKIVDYKNGQEICTNLDRETEKLIISELKKHFPDHNFAGEEFAEENNNSPYTWHIDPIDGTDNFIKKIPFFAISIGLAEKNKLILGVVYNPATHEMFFAAEGLHAHLTLTEYDHLITSEETIILKVSDQDKLSESEVHIGMPKRTSPTVKEDQTRLKKIITIPKKIRNMGSGALSLCYTASGAFDGFIDLTAPLRIFDLAAAIVILKEAGGKISDFQGNIFTTATKRVVCSNGLIHEEILKLL